MVKLFSYGTLKLESVQLDNFGRILIGSNDILVGYEISEIEINDPRVIKSSGTNVHPIMKYTGDKKDLVEGVLFELTDEELINTDKYEVDDYKRVELTFDSGNTGYAYVEGQ
ncbi:gamma-glutamylcyclotransferase family protein [Psychroflexus sp. MES1-P1E]|uniref:gamma-glutamylcyclotransferase family protein n=1 Tax=Psychroflexus sp. MES1-P1E TaxID=2058320 RepID=UPI000C79CA01|nr:gamma-glutamylcyclotransferase family protein [Psychroflexus sp. MES1-P1E]PKG43832.1 UDP-N-acetylmuramate--alanine ligase [Psychroflexus sp. MES1-P1E]